MTWSSAASHASAMHSSRRSRRRSVKIEFIAGFGPIVREPAESRSWWSVLGLDLHEIAPDYYGTDEVDGARAFALWPLPQAAENTFGTSEWPADMPVPQ